MCSYQQLYVNSAQFESGPESQLQHGDPGSRQQAPIPEALPFLREEEFRSWVCDVAVDVERDWLSVCSGLRIIDRRR
jgi:hypothetical protein